MTSRLLFVSFSLVASFVACSPRTETTGPTEQELQAIQLAQQEARGAYLVNALGACTFCHTPLNPDGSRDMTRAFAGVSCLFDTDPANPDVGCISSRNLTNHETGLKNATDEQVKRALRDGIGTDDKPLSFFMPYWVFHNMDDADLNAIVAFLRTLTPVDHRPSAKQPPWDTAPAAQFIDLETIPKPRADYAEQEKAMRGRYLSSQAGLCIDCHTELSPPGSPVPLNMAGAYAGGREFLAIELGLPFLPPTDKVYSENLTSDATGLQGWSVEDIVRAIKGGVDKDGNGVCAATHGLGTSTYANLTEEDVTDIAHYLASLPPLAKSNPNTCVAPLAR